MNKVQTSASALNYEKGLTYPYRLAYTTATGAVKRLSSKSSSALLTKLCIGHVLLNCGGLGRFRGHACCLDQDCGRLRGTRSR
jgi:hypothetical protein